MPIHEAMHATGFLQNIHARGAEHVIGVAAQDDLAARRGEVRRGHVVDIGPGADGHKGRRDDVAVRGRHLHAACWERRVLVQAFTVKGIGHGGSGMGWLKDAFIAGFRAKIKQDIRHCTPHTTRRPQLYPRRQDASGVTKSLDLDILSEGGEAVVESSLFEKSRKMHVKR